jgi:hypothetical protein
MSPWMQLYSEQAQPLDQQNLTLPKPSLLARLIKSRLESEDNPSEPGPLPAGVYVNLRPVLPRIGMKALQLFLQRQTVDSFPLLYNALALAHPN